jgi:segregation and condensation protein A
VRGYNARFSEGLNSIVENQDPASQESVTDSASEAVSSETDATGAADTIQEPGSQSSPSLDLSAAPGLEELRQQPQQGEMPFAVVLGQAVTELPKDLYIPPRALEVFLEAFEGPLDLLLYLIRRQNLDILEINVAKITEQYMQYVELMDAMQFELAAEYLLMAAMLAEIKSRMLLPRTEALEEDEDDPRALLIRRLQEYERFKKAAEDIEELPRMEREFFPASATPPELDRSRPDPDVGMRELLVALGEVLRRADMYEHHQVQREALSTRERMSDVLDMIRGQQFVPFVSLFKVEEGRLGVVVTFLAIMELIKESLIEIVQTEGFGPIHIKARIEDAGEGEVVPIDGIEGTDDTEGTETEEEE